MTTTNSSETKNTKRDAITSELEDASRTAKRRKTDEKQEKNEDWVNQMAKNAPIHLHEGSLHNCFSWIDPPCGGSPSDFVIVTMVPVHLPPLNPRSTEPRRVSVILGLTRHQPQNELEEQRCIQNHFTSLRRLPALHKEGLMTMFVEANYGGSTTADRIQSYVSPDEFQPIHCVQERMGRPGVWTTSHTEQEAVKMGTHELSKGNVYFADQMVTNDPNSLQQHKTELLDQLRHPEKNINGLGRGLFNDIYWTDSLQSNYTYEAVNGKTV